MRYSILMLSIVLASGLYASQKVSIEELRLKIDSAEGGKKANLLMQLAQDQLDEAGQHYQEGDAEKALLSLNNSAASADDATTTSLASGKRLKDTEIELRRLSQRMQDLRQELSFEDRQPFDQIIQKIEQDRTRLLDRMFKK